MSVPSGWEIEQEDSTMFFESSKADDNMGMVIDYDFNTGGVLENFIDSMISEDQRLFEEQKQLIATLPEEDSTELFETRILSRKPIRVSGLDAIELISVAEYIVLEVFIAYDENVVNVSFRSLPEDFFRNEKLFRKAIETIKIKK